MNSNPPPLPPGRQPNLLPWDTSTWDAAARIAVQSRHQLSSWRAPSIETAESPLPLRSAPQLLLQMIIVPGARTSEGRLIEAVAVPWFEIIERLKRDPNEADNIPPEKWEEIVAGAYKRAGFDEVTLTPRSGDHGRDVIAIKKALGSVRVIDQVKAYKPPRLKRNDITLNRFGIPKSVWF